MNKIPTEIILTTPNVQITNNVGLQIQIITNIQIRDDSLVYL
jgi:hypothetical protein